MLEIQKEKQFGSDIAELIEASDAYSMSLYPTEGRHPVDLKYLASPSVSFFVARFQGRAVGCGALVEHGDGTGELKRMVVLPHARGSGVGKSLLKRLEEAALRKNITILRLETGPLNREALGLYKRNGYTDCGRLEAIQMAHTVCSWRNCCCVDNETNNGPSLKKVYAFRRSLSRLSRLS